MLIVVVFLLNNVKQKLLFSKKFLNVLKVNVAEGRIALCGNK